MSANGYSGFRSHHNELYDSPDFDRVYIIIGGPGTGKSRFMQEIGQEGEKIGAVCDYIYCSSDPHSLDGVILQKNVKKVAVLDGTAPHVRAAKHPGLIEETVNFGAFWDNNKLKADKREILDTEKRKAEHYQTAYDALRLAGVARENLTKELRACILHDKMQKAVEKERKQFLKMPNPTRKIRYLDACSMIGAFSLPLPDAKKKIAVFGPFHSPQLFLEALVNEAETDVDVYPSCYDDKYTKGLYLPQNKSLYFEGYAKGEAEKHINMERFISKKEMKNRKKSIKQYARIEEEMKEKALTCLEKAGREHFALEAIYGKAMNFKKKEKACASLIKTVMAFLRD